MLFFFGWGKKNKEWTLQDGISLVAVWSYVHLFFCPLSLGTEWYLSKGESGVSISKDEAMKLVPKANIGWFQKYGLLIPLLIMLVTM